MINYTIFDNLHQSINFIEHCINGAALLDRTPDQYATDREVTTYYPGHNVAEATVETRIDELRSALATMHEIERLFETELAERDLLLDTLQNRENSL